MATTTFPIDNAIFGFRQWGLVTSLYGISKDSLTITTWPTGCTFMGLDGTFHIF